MKRFLENVGKYQDVAFVMFFGLMIAMLIIPLPTAMVDSLIGLNMAIAVTIIVTSLYLRNVLDLSTFPAIVLLTTLFRLALSVSTTRLILAEGDAGHIITAFGNFVVAGNVVVGLVIFFIVALVQFLVVTKGAERIAEVTARFTLDALPGKQMSIDADVRAGNMTNEEAQLKRFKLEKESQFFGSMDGAMRFVKGDAIAGLVIIAVNLLGGLLIGMLQRGMSAGDALATYSLLTVGDGLVAQIPSMFIAVAAGIVVTRVVKEDAKDVGRDITQQLAEQPRALAIAAAFSVALSLIPGFPTIVFLVLAGLLALAAIGIQLRNGGPVPFLATENAAKRNEPDADRFRDMTPFTSLSLVGNAATKSALQRLDFPKKINDEMFYLNERLGIYLMLPGFRTDERISGSALQMHVLGRLVFSTPDVTSTVSGNGIDNLVTAILKVAVFNAFRTFDTDMSSLQMKKAAATWPRYLAEIEKTVGTVGFGEVIRRMLMHGISLSEPRPLYDAMLRFEEVGRSVPAVTLLARKYMASLIRENTAREHDRLSLIIFAAVAEPDLAPFAFTDIAKFDYRACKTGNVGKKLLELKDEINGRDNVHVVCDPKYGFGLQYFLHEAGIMAWVRHEDEIPDEIETDVLHAFVEAKDASAKTGSGANATGNTPGNQPAPPPYRPPNRPTPALN